jgi:hypothetical protein
MINYELQISNIFWGSMPPDVPPAFTRGMSATHVAFTHCYPPLIYYLTERSLFKKCPPPHGKILKKGLGLKRRNQLENVTSTGSNDLNSRIVFISFVCGNTT